MPLKDEHLTAWEVFKVLRYAESQILLTLASPLVEMLMDNLVGLCFFFGLVFTYILGD